MMSRTGRFAACLASARVNRFEELLATSRYGFTQRGPERGQGRAQRILQGAPGRINHRPQSRDNRGEGKLSLGEIDAFAREHECVRRNRSGFRLGHEAALPDARFAGNQEHAA